MPLISVKKLLHSHDKLGNILNALFLALAAELAVGIDDSRDSLGRVEAGDLHNVLARRIVELGPDASLSAGKGWPALVCWYSHSLRMAGHVVDVAVVARVKVVDMLVQAVKPARAISVSK
jgi:hypothetical protein